MKTRLLACLLILAVAVLVQGCGTGVYVIKDGKLNVNNPTGSVTVDGAWLIKASSKKELEEAAPLIKGIVDGINEADASAAARGPGGN